MKRSTTTTWTDQKISDTRAVLARMASGERRGRLLDALLSRHPLPAGRTTADRAAVDRALITILDATDDVLGRLEEMTR